MVNLNAELLYVSSVASRSPTLERDEEAMLTRRVRDTGDRRAADVLVRAYLRMVIAMAVKYRHYGIPVAELVAEGNCGLVTALHKFDPERGLRFGTYAKHWVRAQMLACVIRSSSQVGCGVGAVRPRLFFKLKRERARMTALLGEGAAADEALAQRLNVSVEALGALIGRLEARSVSLDAPGYDSGERPLDTLSSEDNPEADYFRDSKHDVVSAAVKAALGALDARERFIVEHRMMAAATDELSLAQIARIWGLSRERVRQLEERVKHKLGRSPALQRNRRVSEWFAD